MSRPSFLKLTTGRISELTARVCPDVAHPGLLVALSGGPDSVALLLAAHHWARQTGNPVAAAHLNHQLRGEASDQDAAFCRDLCFSLDIPFHLRQDDPRPVAQRRGQGLEEAGRTLRLAFFASILESQPDLHCLAKGQHRDDQAETVIMRVFRGTGLLGIQGIRPAAGNVIHPLLDFSRREILDFLAEADQPWRTDATNLDGDNTRARLRRELLPLVRDIFGPGCDQTPARLGALLGQDQEYLDSLADEAGRDLATNDDGQDGLRIAGLLDLPAALASRVIRNWLTRNCGADPRRLEFAHVVNILTWLREGQSGTGLDLPDGLRVRRDFDVLRPDIPWEPLPAGQSAADFRILVKRNDSPEPPAAMGRQEGHGRRDQQGHWNLNCPASVLVGNLKVRNPKPGDRFQPFGLDGTCKLSDLFRDKRIPQHNRSEILVVEDETGILWVVGIARAERTRLLPSCEQIVTICVARR